MKQFFRRQQVGSIGRSAESMSGPQLPHPCSVRQVFLFTRRTAVGIVRTASCGLPGGRHTSSLVPVQASAGSPRSRLSSGTAHPAPFSGFSGSCDCGLGSTGAHLDSGKRQLMPPPRPVLPADDSQLLPVQFHQAGSCPSRSQLSAQRPWTVGIGILAYTLGDVQYMRKDIIWATEAVPGQVALVTMMPRAAAWMSTILYPAASTPMGFIGRAAILRRNHCFICNQHFRSGRTLQ